jgi:hypothetical protein
MSFEVLRRKQKAINDLIEAAERIKSALADLSPEDTEAFLDGLRKVIDEHLGTQRTPQSEPAAQVEESPSASSPITPTVGKAPAVIPGADRLTAAPVLTPTQAVEAALAEHPSGLKAGEIVDLCYGKYTTKSKDPVSVIYSAIAGLKQRHRVEYLPDGRYRLRERGGDLAGKSAHACCVILLREAGRPLNALTLAKMALGRGYSGRSKGTDDAVVLSTAKSFWARMSRSDLFEQTDPQTFRLKDGATLIEHESDDESETETDDPEGGDDRRDYASFDESTD